MATKSLEQLVLEYNQITDAGGATLASALRGGALPALKLLDLKGSFYVADDIWRFAWSLDVGCLLALSWLPTHTSHTAPPG